MVFRRVTLLGFLGLGILCLTSVAAGSWRDRVAPSVLRWVDSGAAGERTVLVRILGVSATDGASDSYAASSHQAWLFGGRDAAAQVAVDVAVERTPALLRAESAVWEVGLAPIYGLGLLMARGSREQIRRLAERSDVLAVLDGAGLVPTPAVPAGGVPSDAEVVPPRDILALSSLAADDLLGWMATLGWRFVSRSDIATSEDPDAPLKFSPSAVAPDAPSLDIMGLALADADRRAVESQNTSIAAEMATAAWAGEESISMAVEDIAGLLEAMNQTGADGAVIAAVTLAGSVRSLYVLVRDGTGSGWASSGAPQPGISTTANGWPRSAAPGSPSASLGSYEDRVLVEWPLAAGASTYEILRSVRTDHAYEPIGVVDDLTFRDTSVQTCVQYAYVIRSMTDRGLGLESSPAIGYVGHVPMPVQRIWTDGGSQAGAVLVRWTPVEGATAYGLMRTHPMSDKPQIAAQQYTVYVGPETEFLDTDVIVGQTYNYRVKAMNGCGGGELSPQAQGMPFYENPPDPTRLSAPSWFDATRGQPYDVVVLSWGAVAGAERYRVLRATSYRGEYEVIAETTSRWVEDRDVVLCGDYWYRVQSLAGDRESEPSKVMYGSYGYRPGSPEGVRASIGTYANSIEITWAPMKDAELYNVSRAPAREGPFASIANGLTETEYIDDGLEPGQEFWYKVRASNDCGCSGDLGAVYGATSPK